MEMTSQGADREIKDSLLTKIYKASKENAAISQRKTEAQPRLRSHHYYGFDTKYVSLQSLFFVFFFFCPENSRYTAGTIFSPFYTISFSPHVI